MEIVFQGTWAHSTLFPGLFLSFFLWKISLKKEGDVPHVPQTSAAGESKEGLLHQFPLITGVAFLFCLPPYPGPEPFAPGLHTLDVI